MIAGTGFNRFTLRQTTTPTATPVPACIVLPELTEGPYFVDEQLSLQMEVLKKGFNCESCFGYRT